MYGREADFYISVDDATNVLAINIAKYLRQDDRSIRLLRQYYAGDISTVPDFDDSEIPASITTNTLAVLSGASYDPNTHQPYTDDYGRYIVAGVAAFGLIYGGKKALDLALGYYEDLWGYRPGVTYQWIHITPPNRAFLEHLKLGGAIFTRETAPIVLANTTRPTMPPFWHPNDHKWCRCSIISLFG